MYIYRYMLTLIVDGMRSVRSFNFDKSAASVLTTCVSSEAMASLINLCVCVMRDI